MCLREKAKEGSWAANDLFNMFKYTAIKGNDTVQFIKITDEQTWKKRLLLICF